MDKLAYQQLTVFNHFYKFMKFNYSDIIQSNVKYTNFKCIDVEQISKICEKNMKVTQNLP